MVGHRDRQGRNSRLPWFAAVCVVALGLTLGLHAGANGDLSRQAGLVATSTADSSFEIDRHHAPPGHGGAEHCLSGPSCSAAVAVPEAPLLRIGRSNAVLVPTDFLAHQRNIRPPLHPPNPAVQG
jgi:hypothetical protein